MEHHHFSMGKSTIFMAIFNSKLLVITRPGTTSACSFYGGPGSLRPLLHRAKPHSGLHRARDQRGASTAGCGNRHGSDGGVTRPGQRSHITNWKDPPCIFDGENPL